MKNLVRPGDTHAGYLCSILLLKGIGKVWLDRMTALPSLPRQVGDHQCCPSQMSRSNDEAYWLVSQRLTPVFGGPPPGPPPVSSECCSVRRSRADGTMPTGCTPEKPPLMIFILPRNDIWKIGQIFLRPQWPINKRSHIFNPHLRR